ncbi:MAG: hypothetical protein BWZ10_03434 [candidate division BRC1 bacterium ADurb.BinA364]|nr:MAG: hypothetical protein BWZ10_03434 [candidate division BRC1 bacterium ADurb.BinA364]
MPMADFGPHRISRLIVGANPINGGSHLSRFVNQQMKRYFTPERILEMLARCEAEGVNIWQSSPANLDLFARHRREGGKMNYISLANESEKDPGQLERIVAAGGFAVAHHGEFTDSLFKAGKLESVREYLKKIRDTGLMVGVSTHMPVVIEEIESRGWDLDFYMACVYERHRTREELKALLGYVPIPVREVYLEEDPPRMFQAIRQTEKPCLAFKILAAGRLCDKPDTVEAAFRETFRQIKPNDAVIIGMYPEYEDQVAINASLTRKYGG